MNVNDQIAHDGETDPYLQNQQNIKQMLQYYSSEQILKQTQQQYIPKNINPYQQQKQNSQKFRSHSSINNYQIKHPSKDRIPKQTKWQQNLRKKQSKFVSSTFALKNDNQKQSHSSFVEFSDWSNKNRYTNRSIALPKIKAAEIRQLNNFQYQQNDILSEMCNQILYGEQIKDQKLQSTNQQQMNKYALLLRQVSKKIEIPRKSVNIKFDISHKPNKPKRAMYQNNSKLKNYNTHSKSQNTDKDNKKKKVLSPNQYPSLQEHLRNSFYQINNKDIYLKSNTNKQQLEQRATIINRVMNRKTRKNRTHFLQEYLTSFGIMNKQQPSASRYQLSPSTREIHYKRSINK